MIVLRTGFHVWGKKEKSVQEPLAPFLPRILAGLQKWDLLLIFSGLPTSDAINRSTEKGF